jgi:hypothetical protein
MGTLVESATWENVIYQIETTDPLGGGPNGILNIAAKQLANRTKFLKSSADEVTAARGTYTNLKGRLDSFTPIDTDTQNGLMGAIIEAMASAGLANREIQKERTFRRQTGTVTLTNKGVIAGCTITKSTTATRNLSLASGSVFAKGQIYPVFEEVNGAAVPSNNTESQKTCYAYLFFKTDNSIDFACTELGGTVPVGGIPLYLITVPAGNTDSNDPNLTSVTLSSVRRVEANFPTYFSTVLYANVSLKYPVVDVNYSISLDVISADGSGFQRGDVYPLDRNVNGFKIAYNGVADNLQIRWELSKPDM